MTGSAEMLFVFAMICSACILAQAGDGWRDDFDTADAWVANNPRAPAKFFASDGVLTLIDPPGGEVTWGTSLYTQLPPLDLDKYPYLVVKVAEVTAAFRVTLINRDKEEKIGGLCATSEPGIVVMNVPEQLHWRGKTAMSMGLYTSGTESRVKVDYVKFTDSLSPEERKAYEQWKKLQPKKPAPFHGLEELADRRGWCHAPYFLVDGEEELRSNKPWIENFEGVDAWFANNQRTPPQFSAEEGVLVLKDPPGGEVTWGTSIYTHLPGMNLNKNPYLVVKVKDLSEGFGLTVYNRLTREKIGSLCSTEEPGIFVVDMPHRLGWEGIMPLDIGLYTYGTESWIKLDYIKLTGELTADERAAYERQRDAKEPVARREPFSLPDARPYFNSYFEPGLHYLGERLIYRDSVTGNVVWRMTNYPDTDSVIYYDIAHWNANSTLMRWNSRRGGSRQWLMDANDTNLRAMPATAAGYSSHWSIHDPYVLIYAAREGDRTVIYRVDIRTGEKTEVVSLDEPGFSAVPPHPDEKHFLLSKRSKKDNTSIIYLLGPNGLKRKFDFGRFVHRLRFTKGPGHDIFYNFDDPRTQWAIGADGSNNVHLTDRAGHPDWTWDGKWLTTYTGGNIVAIRRDGSDEYVLVELHGGGHGGPARDSRSFISDVSGSGPYAQSILFVDMPTRVVHKVCMASSSYYGHDNTGWHPDHHSTHPHAASSPDATKTAFSSDFMSKYVNLYVCINHLPDAPRELTVDRTGGKVVLAWQPGERHFETAGYYVYRAEESGGPYRQLNAEPVKETKMEVDGAEGFFVVTAIEPSGLESLPCEEVCAAPSWKGRVRRIIEAESCELGGEVRPYMDGSTAVGMYYVGLTDEGKEGSLKLLVDLPRAGTYVLLARARGEGIFRVDEGPSLVSSGDAWNWVRADKPLQLGAGRQRIHLAIEAGRPEVDQFIVTDETDFTPSGPAVLDNTPPDAPRTLEAKVLDPFDVRLSWTKPDSVDVSYYNVYCGRSADYELCQARLIGSPAEPQFVDWGLRPSATYHYKVVAVDRCGNESKPAAAKAITLPAKLATVTVEAELGKTTAPAQVVEDKRASSEKAVEFPAGDERGALEIEFEVPFDDRYAIWAHAFQLEGNPRPMKMAIDNKVTYPWKMNVPMKKWGWDSMGSKRSGDPQLFALRKGKHSLTLSGCEGQRIGQIVISNNPRWPHNGFETLRRYAR